MTAPNSVRRRGRGITAAFGVAVLAAGSLAFASAANAAEEPLTLLTDASTWKYSDNNTDPAAGTADRLVWTKAGFDDGGWKSGTFPAGAQRDGSDVFAQNTAYTFATKLNMFVDPGDTTSADIPTYHFRNTFALTAGQLSRDLIGTLSYDDGARVYVNGTLVFDPDAAAFANVDDAQENLHYMGGNEGGNGPAFDVSFRVPASVLKEGENTIAIALYNDRPSSSDTLLDLKSLVQAPPSGAPTDIILGVGADESQRIVTWYTDLDSEQQIQVAPSSQVVDGKLPASATVFSALGSANIASSGGFNRHGTITGLQENTSYSYRVGAEGAWSPVYTFQTHAFEGDYDFLFFGDPQIGASGNVGNDSAGWVDTVNVATAANPDAELLVSGGDQVNTANNETEWDGFLAPEQLREVPWAATIGNHDVGGKAYEQHLYTPNTDRSAAYYNNGDPNGSASGGDYWFIHKDVLFIDLNSNSYKNNEDGSAGDDAHVKYVTDVINQHGADAKYTVLVYHHAIYSPASHAKDGDNKQRRVDFTTAFSDLGVDLVLQGHDHAYSRSYEIRNGQKANPEEQPGQSDVFVGPGGVIYLTGNSASGSKYYGITAPDASGTGITGQGPDPLNPGNYWYNSVQNQENSRSYVKVQVRADQLVVQNIRSQANKFGEVGSFVDNVTIHPYNGDGSQQLQVGIQGEPGEFGWAIDGYNGLVDLGTAEIADGFAQASGQLNPITVTDTRRVQAPWSLSGSVGDFADGDKKFSGAHLGWTPKVLEHGAGVVAGDAVEPGSEDGSGLSISRDLAQADAVHEPGASRVGADLSLRVPASVANGTYRATLTITGLGE